MRRVFGLGDTGGQSRATEMCAGGETRQCLRPRSIAPARVGETKVGVADSTLAAESEYAKYSFLGCSWAVLEACKVWIKMDGGMFADFPPLYLRSGRCCVGETWRSQWGRCGLPPTHVGGASGVVMYRPTVRVCARVTLLSLAWAVSDNVP